jgi:hypothetical protein
MSALRPRLCGIAVSFLCWVASAIAPAGALAATVFGLLDTGELYRSTNNGVTWSAIGAIPVRDAVGLAAGSNSTDLYLVSRSGTVYRSTNAGTTWSAVGAVAASDVSGFALTAFGNVLVLTSTGTLYASSNQGATFTAIAALAGSDWVGLARGPLGRLYALTRSGQVAESQNQGTAWATVGVITTSDAVAIRRLGAQLFVLASTGEVYRSLNYGVSWIAVGALSQGSMSALVDLGAQLVAATKEGEVASSANGASWAWVGAINQLDVVALGTDTPQVTGVVDEESPPKFAMAAPYPNPRAGAGGATFGFTVPAPDRVRLELYDVRGLFLAARPFETIATGGAHAIRWEPASLSAATYLVRLVTESGHTAQTKWVVLR